MSTQTILIVEDHAGMRALLMDLLRAAFPQHTILGVSNGEEALTLTILRRPVVVVMDIMLPQLNGIETARRIKQNVPEAKVVILSLYEAPEYRADATTAGVSAYLLKRNLHLELVPTLQNFMQPG